jgi:hypothetical protein
MTSDTYQAPYQGDVGWSENFSGELTHEIAGSLPSFTSLRNWYRCPLWDHHRLGFALTFKRQGFQCTIIWITCVRHTCCVV